MLREIGLLAVSSGRYRGSREELVPLRTDPWCAIPLGVVVRGCCARLRQPRSSRKQTVAAYSLTAHAIHRLRAWQNEQQR